MASLTNDNAADGKTDGAEGALTGRIPVHLLQKRNSMVTLHLDDDVIRSLSDNELNILKYVYTHAEDIVHISIHEMAKQVSYSTATILRFCKKLGYSGFSEFKYALAAAIRRSPAPPAPAKPANLDTQMILEQICSHIESTSHLILDKQLEQVFHIFDDNCRIYLYSPGGITATLIDYFEKMLFSIGRQNVYKIESVRMGEHILRNFPEASAWILISTTGSFPHTARLARLARMNNVPVISITPYTNNTIADLADINFRFFTRQREYQDAEFTSRLPIFYVISTIFQCYLEYRRSAPWLTPVEENK